MRNSFFITVTLVGILAAEDSLVQAYLAPDEQFSLLSEVDAS